MGPYQPNSEYERTSSKTQTRGFVKSWFTQFDWLKYSPGKNAAYCFYCYLFKPPATSEFDNDVLTRVGFRNWKKGKESLLKHSPSINGYHSTARKWSIDFKNQRQSVQHVWAVTTAAEEVAYKAHLTIMLGIPRFLLLQALAFCGHDESKTSKNKGNFLEMLDRYRKKDPKAALVTGKNALGNNQMS
jgi:hypothetical protein